MSIEGTPSTKAPNAKSSEHKLQTREDPVSSVYLKRGWPGVLLTCERGREIKCQREGLDILSHYLDRGSTHDSSIKMRATCPSGEQQESSSLVVSANDKTSSANSGRTTLEQELEQLRQQHKQQQQQGRKNRSYRSNDKEFTAYDTGCRGVVLLLCTKRGQLVPRILDLEEHNDDNPVDVDGSIVDNGKTRKRERDEGEISGPNKTKQDSEMIKLDDVRGLEAEEGPCCKRPKQSADMGNQQTTDPKPETTTTTTLDSKCNPFSNMDVDVDENIWDPVITVESILEEACPQFIETKDKPHSIPPPPSSRFVTRIIPLQATCWASLEEIRATTQKLLERFLQNDLVVSSTPKEEKSCSSRHKKTVATEPTTFGIFIKRRNCSHLSSQMVIESLASHVMSPLVPTWKVDLKDPCVKIWVEICRTLVGISVFRVSSWTREQKSRANFNLAEIRASMKT